MFCIIKNRLLATLGLILLLCIHINAEKKIYTLYDILSYNKKTNDYRVVMDDSIINELNHKIFTTNLYPQIRLNANLPNYEKSISLTSQYDGTYKYRSRTYANSEVNLQVSQLIPWTGGTMSFTTGINRLDNLTNENKTFSYYYNIGQITIKQNVFSYNSYKWAKKQDEANKIIERIQHQQSLEKINYKLVECFFNLLMAQRRQELNKQNLILSKEIYDHAKLLFKEERLSEPDFIDTEIEYLKEKMQNNNLEIKFAQDEFNKILQLHTTDNPIAEFDDTTMVFNPLSFDINEIAEKSVEYNYSIIQDSKELDQIIQIKKIKEECSPSVTLELGGGFNSQFEKFRNAYDNKLDSRQIALTLTVPIYDGGKGKAKIAISKYQLSRIKNQYNIDRDDAKNGYIKDLLNINLIIEAINNYKNTLGLIDNQMKLIKYKIDGDRLNVEQYLRVKSEKMKAFVNYYELIKEYYMYIFKYRSLALYDLRSNKSLLAR